MQWNCGRWQTQGLADLRALSHQLAEGDRALLADGIRGEVGERGKLLEKNELARQKIQTMISRLKSLSAEQ